jgi:hypothetical protein
MTDTHDIRPLTTNDIIALCARAVFDRTMTNDEVTEEMQAIAAYTLTNPLDPEIWATIETMRLSSNSSNIRMAISLAIRVPAVR